MAEFKPMTMRMMNIVNMIMVPTMLMLCYAMLCYANDDNFKDLRT